MTDYQLESQLLTLIAMKGGNDSILYGIYGVIAMTLVKNFVKALPFIVNMVVQLVTKFFRRHVPLPTLTTETTSRIVYDRNYAMRKDDNITDSILDYLCKLDCTKDLAFNSFYMVNNDSVIKLNNHLSIRIIEKVFKDGVLQSIKFELTSSQWLLSELKAWTDGIEKEYQIEKKNQFGTKRYFFDEIMLAPEKGLSTLPNHLTFSMTEFCTNKSLKNVYGKKLEIVKTRVDLFINHPEWYANRGIPHTLGLLLHGPPGTGKTSLIKAIAKDTKRHIFNIKLRKDTRPSQLNDLFYSESVHIRNQNGYQSVLVPTNQRIYVIEDVDCLSEVVLDRDQSPKEESPKNARRWQSLEAMSGMSDPDHKKNEDPITLSFLLNLFDGILETPGRILIMTSNFPDRLDKALIRPGRIDLNLQLGTCDDEQIEAMYKGFFEDVKEVDFKGIEEKKHTPAVVQEILCNNFNDPVRAYEKLKAN